MELDEQCPASYSAGCKIVIVGDAPSKEDVDAKDGFSSTGQTGRCLRKACMAADLQWEQVGRSNVAKRSPGSDRDSFYKTFYHTVEEPIYTPTGKLSKRTAKTTLWTEEYEKWQDRLVEELRLHNPNLIVAAGNEAISAITGYSGVNNYRGSVVGSRGAFTRADGTTFKTLCVEHPRYIVKGKLEEFWFLATDLRKAKREAEFAEIRRTTWEQRLPPYTIEDAVWMLSIIRDNPTWKWTLDVETRAGTLACFSIAYWNGSNYCTFCVPVQTPQGPYWNSEDECEIWRALNETALANPNLCNQNIEYDIYYLLRYGIEPSGVYMDTMLAHNLLYPEFPKGLDFLCSFYLDDVVYYKGEGRSWNDGDREEQLWEYCCKDAIYTLRIMYKIDVQLKERGLFQFYHGSD